MIDYINNIYQEIISKYNSGEDPLLYALQMGRYALENELEFDEKILVKKICEFVIFLDKDKLNETNEELYGMLIEVNNRLVLNVSNLDELIRSLGILKISSISCDYLSYTTYKNTNELYEDISKALLNKIYRKNSNYTSFKRGYLYNVSLLILDNIEKNPNIDINDPQLVSLLKLVTKNRLFIKEADLKSKEIDEALKYSIVKKYK